MEKVEIEIVETEETTHHFYCDDCGDYIGSSEEYDDGWYEELGEFELHWYTPKGWYKLEKCLCHTCAKKYLSTVYGGLESAGFKLDTY
jgi:hypothetical protein